MYARVTHAIAQIVLKIEKLSRITGTAQILLLRSPSPIIAPGVILIITFFSMKDPTQSLQYQFMKEP